MFTEIEDLINEIEYAGGIWLEGMVSEDAIKNDDAFFSLDKISFEPDWTNEDLDLMIIIEARAKLPKQEQVCEKVFITVDEHSTPSRIAWYVIGYISSRLDMKMGL